MRRAEEALYALQIVTIVGIVLLARRAKFADVMWSAVLVGVAVLWLAADKPLEGHTLWVVTSGHGITSGDLLALPTVGVAVALTARYVHGRRRGRRASRRAW
jgi:hypothetical protein